MHTRLKTTLAVLALLATNQGLAQTAVSEVEDTSELLKEQTRDTPF